jgi:hypothetical protein
MESKDDGKGRRTEQLPQPPPAAAGHIGMAWPSLVQSKARNLPDRTTRFCCVGKSVEFVSPPTQKSVEFGLISSKWWTITMQPFMNDAYTSFVLTKKQNCLVCYNRTLPFRTSK